MFLGAKCKQEETKWRYSVQSLYSKVVKGKKLTTEIAIFGGALFLNFIISLFKLKTSSQSN